MGLHSGNVIARVASALRVVGPFYGIRTDGKGEGYSPLKKCKQMRLNENFKLKNTLRHTLQFWIFFMLKLKYFVSLCYKRNVSYNIILLIIYEII